MNDISANISVSLPQSEFSEPTLEIKKNDKILQQPVKGRHRRTRSTITAEMLANTDIQFNASEQ